jgi:hypothetical protein
MRSIPTTLATFGMLATLAFVHAPELHGLQEPVLPQSHGQEVLEGQVMQVNDQELTVRTEEGATVTFQVDAETEVKDSHRTTPEAEGREDVTDLSPGDRVVVHYRAHPASDERVAVAIEIRSEQASASLWQTIGIQPGDRMDQEIRTEGAEQELHLPEDTHGDPVAGRIAEVHGDEVTIRTPEGEAKTFQIASDTRVMDATGQEIQTEDDRLAALSIGAEVVVHARADATSAEPIAQVIEVRTTR